VFVVETTLTSQFAWVSVFSFGNLSLEHAVYGKGKGKAVPLLAWTGPEDS
jgi:hypothetical protein